MQFRSFLFSQKQQPCKVFENLCAWLHLSISIVLHFFHFLLVSISFSSKYDTTWVDGRKLLTSSNRAAGYHFPFLLPREPSRSSFISFATFVPGFSARQNERHTVEGNRPRFMAFLSKQTTGRSRNHRM